MADFINRVTEHFDELTKSHKEVANYFLYNLDKVAEAMKDVISCDKLRVGANDL